MGGRRVVDIRGRDNRLRLLHDQRTAQQDVEIEEAVPFEGLGNVVAGLLQHRLVFLA